MECGVTNACESVFEYLVQAGWLPVQSPYDVTFLAAGEYNENYLVKTAEGRHVFRINHGSQLGLDNQIEYEFQVLEAVFPSGVTPAPLRCDRNPGHDMFGQGVLLMSYLPGGPLDYDRDMLTAAEVFARVHGVSPGVGLIEQRNPVLDIAKESLGLIQRYVHNHPMEEKRGLLLDYHAEVLRMGEEVESMFASEPQVIVNTEVNSHNFLIDESGPNKQGFLVDWEKAVVSCRYQDLGHFLVPTTTLWKTQKRYSVDEKKLFLREYRERAGLECGLEELLYKTSLLEKTILLRAMAWCFMAFFEYTQEDRVLKNQDAFKKITQYLGEMECFFA